MTTSVRTAFPVLLQILLWVFFGNLVLFYGPLSWDITVPREFWIKQALVFITLVTLYYFNTGVLVPRYLFSGRTWVFVIALLITVAIFLAFHEWLEKVLHLRELMAKAFNKPLRPEKRQWFPFNGFLFLLLGTVLGIGTSVKSIQKAYHDSELRLQLEQQNTATELSYLKAQINPHFFFNTLNNIYALTLIDVEHSRQALHKLSRMMRYLLYETQNDSTLLSKEIDFVKDYIELMRLRVNENITILFEEPQNLNDKPVSPMLFLPYIENAFKHGISSIQNGHIYIFFRQREDKVQLEVINTIHDEKPASLEDSSGIGLANTRRRLDLLYPGKHTLKSGKTDSGEEYRVKLNLFIA